MNNENFILTYVQSCVGGKLGFADCGPVWQLGIVAVLIVVAILFLILLRVRPPGSSPQA